MAKKRKRSPTKLVPELILDSRELENIVFACAAKNCRCRIELTPDDEFPEGAICPSCGTPLVEERRLFKLYCDAYEELFRAPHRVRFRIAPRGRFPIYDDGRRRP